MFIKQRFSVFNKQMHAHASNSHWIFISLVSSICITLLCFAFAPNKCNSSWSVHLVSFSFFPLSLVLIQQRIITTVKTTGIKQDVSNEKLNRREQNYKYSMKHFDGGRETKKEKKRKHRNTERHTVARTRKICVWMAQTETD